MKIKKIFLAGLLLLIPSISQAFMHGEGELVTMYGRITEIGEHSITVSSIIDDDNNTQKKVVIETTNLAQNIETLAIFDLYQAEQNVDSDPDYNHLLFQNGKQSTNTKRYIFTYRVINDKNILEFISSFGKDKMDIVLDPTPGALSKTTALSSLVSKDGMVQRRRVINGLTEETYTTTHILGNVVEVRYTPEKDTGIIRCYMTIRYQNEHKKFIVKTFEIHNNQYEMFHLARDTMFYGMVPVKLQFCTEFTEDEPYDTKGNQFVGQQPMVLEAMHPTLPKYLKEYKTHNIFRYSMEDSELYEDDGIYEGDEILLD